MIREAMDKYPIETGGLLLGYTAENDSVAVVTHVRGPGPNAVHAKNRYSPDHEHDEKQVARLHDTSGGTVLYLGDWHSHPDGASALSAKDRRTLKTIALSATARLPSPLMVIVAGGEFGADAWETAVYRGHLSNGRWWRALSIVRCDVTEFHPSA
jgi:integrative and conjugative element protein (TIGR02256 family)